MARPHAYRVTAIVLKRRTTGETDRIVTVFTRERGKLRLMAKGIRKVGSRRSPYLEPLRVSLLVIHEGPGMPIVSQADGLPGIIVADDRSMLTVAGKYYVAELLDSLMPDDEPHEQVFDRAVDVLRNLSAAPDDDRAVAVLIGYTAEILKLLGFIAPDHSFATLSEAVTAVEGIIERRIKSRKILSYSR
jgi:DNA repair protein RecO (recombination protein O)